jgi:hypothetical protein
MEKDKIIGRAFLQMDGQKAADILRKFQPMLCKSKYVEQIFAAVQEQFQDETYENRRLIFIATVYQVYQPLSFLDQTAGKLPAGIRDEMSRCLGFNNPEMVNHFKTFCEPQMKPFNNGPERPFKVKVMEIVERFRPYSIIQDDYQFKLGL